MEALPKFAVDRMLARVARWLRMLGADAIFDEGIDCLLYTSRCV